MNIISLLSVYQMILIGLMLVVCVAVIISAVRQSQQDVMWVYGEKLYPNIDYQRVTTFLAATLIVLMFLLSGS